VTASPPDPTTLNELFFSSLDRFGARPVLLRWKQDGTWREMSYQELLSRVQALSLGLADLGVQPGDRVAIISENRPEWAITDYACLTPRCADLPPTLLRCERSLAGAFKRGAEVWPVFSVKTLLESQQFMQSAAS
jgi:acyl-CoA synthetase (AMP-forming)/AMP-acid ligase II